MPHIPDTWPCEHRLDDIRECDRCRCVREPVPLTEPIRFSERSFTLAGLAEFEETALWAEGLLLGEYLAQTGIKGTVVDVGCGIGTAGLAALALGCQVTFTDRNEQALSYAARNAENHGFVDFDTLLLNWRDSANRQWDNIISASTLWYCHDQVALIAWMRKHWSGRGRCLVAYSGRLPDEIRHELWRDTGLSRTISGKHYATDIYEVIQHREEQSPELRMPVQSDGPSSSREPPPLVQQAWNLVSSLAAFVADGLQTVSKQEYAARLEICDSCEYRHENRCLQCGCYMPVKARGRAFRCPINKWPTAECSAGAACPSAVVGSLSPVP